LPAWSSHYLRVRSGLLRESAGWRAPLPAGLLSPLAGFPQYARDAWGADWLRPNRAWCSHGKPCLVLLQSVTLSEVSPNVSPMALTKQKGQSEDWPKCLILLARPERFERPTPWFVAKYSIQLSYGRLAVLEPRLYRAGSPRSSTIWTNRLDAGAAAVWRVVCALPAPTGMCRVALGQGSPDDLKHV
jgi:hypothetical protein